jgi:hypothetical protein
MAAALLACALPARAEEIRIEVARGAVKTLDLEDYVAGVVTSEVPPLWPGEALKAQAVAARTFAVAQKVAQGPGARAHLSASMLDKCIAPARIPRPLRSLLLAPPPARCSPGARRPSRRTSAPAAAG